MRVVVLGNAHRPGVSEAAEELLPKIQSMADVLAVDLFQDLDLSGLEPDYAIVLGGDGAILRAARQMGYRQFPVLGINLGRLGFLADYQAHEIQEILEGLKNREGVITRHLMFECVESSAPSTIPNGSREIPGITLGLNEVLLQTRRPFRMAGIELEIEGRVVSQYRSDGLIVSTPIGSTAHSLSAGGPILGQDLEAFVITPICPHVLTSRPLVESANRSITLRLSPEMGPLTAIVDGNTEIHLNPGEWIQVRKAPVSFQLVRLPGRSFYRTLREKLSWGTLPQYREETQTAKTSPPPGRPL